MKKEAIAIVGVSCRFPNSSSLSDFWELLKNGQTTVTEMTNERWQLNKFYDPDPTTPNKSVQKHGSFLSNIHDFDPFLFNISPAEAIEMSPSQKLMLELVWEAIENSNIAYNKVTGKKTGVYVGNIWSDFEHERKHKNANTTSHSAVGQSANIIANRVSYNFGFQGPSLVVDTGCSSSLVALHLACQSLWEGSTNMCVVGAINHILDHDQYILLSKFGGLSVKGSSSAFDANADGFVRGEGAGVIMIKPLSQAEADGDQIWAVIKGSAMNNNGYNVNLPATSAKGQMDMLEEAYKDSGIEPSSVHYVEAHGTGTKLGDPTEAKALGTFFAKNRPEDRFLRIGSVKTNLGHLEGAAGMAGLIKVLLAMKYRQLPQSLHFHNPNPEIPFDELKLKVNNELSDWPLAEGELMKAGVNSFGWGGTNAHAVLEEYKAAKPAALSHSYPHEQYLFVLSAKTEKALKEYAKNYRQFLEDKINGVLTKFQESCIATAVMKPNLDYRVSMVAENKQALMDKLNQFANDPQTLFPAAVSTSAKVVFVFPGQGSQWLGMGRTLYNKEEVFKNCLDECETAFKKHVDWSLLNELFANETSSRLKEIDVIQPTLFAVEIALAKLWMSWGVVPHAVIGHSMGEVASAYISGALSLDDAANVICSRSKLMKTVSGKGGAMGVTELDPEKATKRIAQYNGTLSVAVNNSPKSTVIAGKESDLLHLLSILEGEELFCRQVKVDVASHSPQMDPLIDPLAKQLQGIRPKACDIPYYSTVENAFMEGTDLGKDYWLKNLRNMVRFSESVQTLYNDGHTVFIEMSPHPVLTNAVNECIEPIGGQSAIIPSLLRDEPEIETILANVGRLYEKGISADWMALYRVKEFHGTELPPYPMQRQTYALEDRTAQSDKFLANVKNPLLGRRILLAGSNDIYIWENRLSLEHLSFVKDHKVNDTTVLPGVSYLETLHAALQDAFGNAYHEVKSLNFRSPVYLHENDMVDTQLKIVRRGQHDASFSYYVKVEREGAPDWLLTADGELYVCGSRTEISNEHIFNLNREENDHLIPKEHFYKVTNAIGIQYGNLFQGINWVRINNKRAIAHVVPNSLIVLNDHHYFIHPAILDSCFQTIFTPLQNQLNGGSMTTYLSRLEGFKWFSKPEKHEDIVVKAELKATIGESEAITKHQVELSIYDESGNYVAHVDLLEAIIINNDKLETPSSEKWLYRTQWEKIPFIENKVEQAGNWLIFNDHLGVEKHLGKLFKKHHGQLIKVSLGENYLKIDDDEYVVNYRDEASIFMMLKSIMHQNIKIDGIIHAASLNDHISYENLVSSEFHKILEDSSLLTINLHKALSRLQTDVTPRLVLLSNGLQPVENKNAYLNITQAPMWGLGKVLFNEQPLLNCLRIDMSYFPDKRESEALFEIIHETGQLKEPELALRENMLFGSRLTEDHVPVVNLDRIKFDPASTVVVTGFRGAAIPLIEWMADNGARHFALLSRSGKASSEAMKTLEGLTQHYGITCNIYRSDVSEYDALEKTFEIIESEMPAINGIVHAAGVIEAKKIQELSYADYLKILLPKVHGTWNLHKLSLSRDIKTFFMFSSASSLIGLSGQGSYVSANTFVDQMAHYRKKIGLPATAINWGVIEDVGMVANEADLERYAQAEGFVPVKMRDAVEKMDKVINQNPVQVGIGRLELEKTAEYYSSLAATNYFSKVLQTGAENGEKSGSQLSITGLTKEQAIESIELLVKQKVSAITKASVSDISSGMTFKGLGIDSLMAIQLRNQIQKVTGLTLAVTQFWKYPSIQQFSSFVYTRLTDAELQPQESAAKWLIKFNEQKDTAYKLFCFHDAGGSSSLFENWTSDLKEHAEVIAIELPGRKTRIHETPMTDMKEIVEILAGEISIEAGNMPFAFFGHSMGGAIQFEVLKVLRKRQLPLPMKIFTSSTPALFTYEKRKVVTGITEEELVARFPHLSRENIKDEEWRQSLIGILKADMQLLQNYDYSRDEPFNIPIVSIRGREDEGVSLEQVEAWNEETNGIFTYIERPGGHRYIEHDTPFLTSLVREELAEIIQNEIVK